jgi:hypothetical protein
MHRAPSFCGGGQATFGQQLIDQRSGLWNIRRQAAQLVGGILLPLKDEALTDQVKVKAVAGRETQCRPDIGRDHQASLLA